MPHTKSIPMKLKFFFLVLMTVTLSSVQAFAALTQNEVSMLYVSIFNRASEGEGNTYWGNRADLPTMAAVAAAMLDTEPARNYFGSSLDTNQAFIEHIYLNTLNKTIAQDPDGIAYWVGLLESGTSRGEVVAQMVGVIGTYAPGASNYDSTDPVTIAAYNQFTNRVTISNYMADSVQDPPANWATATQFGPGGLNVTSDGATVDTARQAVNLIAGNPGGSLEDDVEYYMALFSSTEELSPMVDELSTLLSLMMDPESPVVTITPPLETIDINNPPPNINITADFGAGYTPPESTAVYTGSAVINITGIGFTNTGIAANVSLTATNVQRNGEPILNGDMTGSLNLGLAGENMSLTGNLNFSNLASMEELLNGGIALNVPAISGEGQLLQPATLTLNQFSTTEYQLNGIVTVTQTAADIFDIDFNITTNQGEVTGRLRAQGDVQNPDLITLTTPQGPLTVGTAQVTVNQVIIDSSEDTTCTEWPVSGNIVVTEGGETATITFNNCAYTVN